MQRKRLVSWNQCTTLRTEFEQPRKVDPQTSSQRRRRSLHRGALRFVRDVCADGRKYHRCLLFALTVAGLDPDPCQGAIRDIFQRMRAHNPGLRYLWWAEFQKRGALHYHGMIVDPPFEFERDARHWFDQRWPHAQIQTWVEVKSASWFRSSAGAYALKDVRKVGGKTYEQQYENMPASWKTYSTHRLTFAAEEHHLHENHPYVGWNPQTREVQVEALDEHVPAAGGCKLVHRRPGRGRKTRTQMRRATWKLLNRPAAAERPAAARAGPRSP